MSGVMLWGGAFRGPCDASRGFRRARGWILPVAVLAAIGCGGCGRSGSPEAELEWVPVTRSTVIKRQSFQGVLVDPGIVSVFPVVAGRVEAVLVDVGDRVSKGAPLIRIESSREEREVERRRLLVKRAEAQKARADESASGAPLASGVDEALARLDYANAVETLRERTVRAPIDGTVTTVTVAVGVLMAPEGGGRGAPVTLFASTRPQQVEVYADEFGLQGLGRGQKALVSLETRPDRVVPATVTTEPLLTRLPTGPGVPAQFGFTLSLERRMDSGRAGMSVRIEVEVERHEEVTSVPVDAVVRHDDHNDVLLRTPAGQLETRRVSLGIDDGSIVEILTGLEEGEVVGRGQAAEIRKFIRR